MARMGREEILTEFCCGNVLEICHLANREDIGNIILR
jgi:hypothetical protein